MTDRHPEWQAIDWKGQILAAYKLPGAPWRYLRRNGERLTFPSADAARQAARQRAMDILFPEMRSSKEPSDADIADKLGLTDWIKSRREDVKKQTTMHRAGKRQVIVLGGRA